MIEVPRDWKMSRRAGGLGCLLEPLLLPSWLPRQLKTKDHNNQYGDQRRGKMKIIWSECLRRQLQQTTYCLCSSSGVIMSLAVMSDIHWDLPVTVRNNLCVWNATIFYEHNSTFSSGWIRFKLLCRWEYIFCRQRLIHCTNGTYFQRVRWLIISTTMTLTVKNNR